MFERTKVMGNPANIEVFVATVIKKWKSIQRIYNDKYRELEIKRRYRTNDRECLEKVNPTEKTTERL